ncbi:LCP family protein [Desulfosporosinus sp. SB140]|uniref:LCP family protein n=1 Tax=Desulfosporosinus paludis TaxID=3115649 RepID=UPI00388D0B21
MAQNKYYQHFKSLKSLLFIVMILATLVSLKYPIKLAKIPKSELKQLQVNVGQSLTGNVYGKKGPINVLLIGNNARNAATPLSLGTAAGQADLLIVAHIDPDLHKVSLISIPRDTLVAMPDYKEPIPKIKSSFELGLQQSPEEGPNQAVKYVSKLTGLKIDYYVVTGFKGFADAIDAVGGIQVNIPGRLYDPEYSQANFQPGLQTLNGDQALAYIRIRQNIAGNSYRTNDFQRQDAELEILNLLKTKLLASGISLSNIEKLQETWRHDVATNIPTPMLIGMGLEVSGSQMEQIRLGSVKDSIDITNTPLDGINQEGYLSGAYYDVLDPEEISHTLKPYGSIGASTGLSPIPNPKTVTINVYGSQSVGNELQKAGFNTRWISPDSGGSQVEIYYPQGQIMAALSVARILGTGNELVSPSQTVSVITVYTP